MGTVGQAYNLAVEMHEAIGEEAAFVASESAELCRRKGDDSGAHYWEQVTAFVTHLCRPESKIIQ